MSRRQIALLALLVCVPLASLAWLGGRLVRDEQARMRRDLQQLLGEQLGDVNQIIARFFQKRESELLRVTDLESFDVAPIRDTVRSHPHLLQLFVLDPDGELLHPALDGPLNQSERGFLERAHIFLQDKDLLRAAQQNVEHASAGVPASNQGASKASEEAAATHGWYAWYWGRGVHLVFWRRLPTGVIVGASWIGLDGSLI